VERAALVDQELERIDAEIDRLGLTVEHDHHHDHDHDHDHDH
jgi:ribosome assembly protein YihI (activator of Der GTPase)